jgi:hypothetical protein
MATADKKPADKNRVRLTKMPKAGGVVSRRTEPKEEKERKTRITFSLTEKEANDARAAFLSLPRKSVEKTFSDFIAAAVMARVAEVRAKYNDGEEFEELAPRSIPTGRPMTKLPEEPVQEDPEPEAEGE